MGPGRSEGRGKWTSGGGCPVSASKAAISVGCEKPTERKVAFRVNNLNGAISPETVRCGRLTGGSVALFRAVSQTSRKHRHRLCSSASLLCLHLGKHSASRDAFKATLADEAVKRVFTAPLRDADCFANSF
ncbi:hypothetical protein E2C01_044880 [Portunus trituberculatus]|uniref:Uncharacterized protein n=1 Tax=Portunus trituberculatus TaxID=210409 RepID=A0A5B7G1B3_PORTR|nr:hypothetical protein [Portunus trituberculatus]